MQSWAVDLLEIANVYTINRDTPTQTTQVRQLSGTTLPILFDKNLTVAQQFDFLPKNGQPMGSMSGIPQMGFVIIDINGIIRVQRVDVYFGENAGQVLEILRSLEKE